MEDDDVGFRNGQRFRCGQDLRENLGLADDESGRGGFEVVRQLEGGVGWVCAGEDGAAADDPKGEHDVLKVIEGVDTDTVTWADAESAKPSDEAADETAGLRVRYGLRRVCCIDEHLGRGQRSGVNDQWQWQSTYGLVDIVCWTVEEPREDVSGREGSMLSRLEEHHVVEC